MYCIEPIESCHATDEKWTLLNESVHLEKKKESLRWRIANNDRKCTRKKRKEVKTEKMKKNEREIERQKERVKYELRSEQSIDVKYEQVIEQKVVTSFKITFT